MVNTIISKLAVGFISLGAMFSMGFVAPEAANNVQIATSIAKSLDYSAIAKLPIVNGLKINQAHIFQGEINRRGLAVGYHHRLNGIDGNNARMSKLTGMPNRRGVYTGRVEIRRVTNGEWVSKVSGSSFFPDLWSREKVLSEIRGAFNASDKNKEPWQGTSPSGLQIQGYYNKSTNTITTAYPIYRR